MKTLLSRLDFSYIYAFLGEITLGITFLFYILLARFLGPEQYGIFASATALGGILAFFIQFGLPTLLAREVAADPHEGSKSTIKFLLLEVLNSLPVLILLLPLAQILGFKGTGIMVCYLVVLAEICRSAKQTLRAVFRGIGKFRDETVSVAIERLFVAIIAGTVLLWSQDLVWVVATLVIVRQLDILGLIYYLNKQTSIWSPINIKSLWKILQMAYPFALSGVLWVLYYQIDVLMLKVLAPTEQAGFYSASYRIIEIFSALPRVIFLVTFTRFAQCHAKTPERLPEEINKSVLLLLVIVLPILAIAAFYQTNLVTTIYGQAFSPAVNSLAILLPSLSIKMFATLMEYFLQATGREKSLPPLLLSTVLVNIIVNTILIPILGAVGAAVATLISEIILAIFGLNLMIRIGYKQVGKRTRLIAIISLLLAATPSLIINGLNPILGMVFMFTCATAIFSLIKQNPVLKNMKIT
ncbi:MAG: flippase [Calothrix sp. MO_167.B12]|nr:flippase [Calothrix sp. MO_167.B12]